MNWNAKTNVTIIVITHTYICNYLDFFPSLNFFLKTILVDFPLCRQYSNRIFFVFFCFLTLKFLRAKCWKISKGFFLKKSSFFWHIPQNRGSRPKKTYILREGVKKCSKFSFVTNIKHWWELCTKTYFFLFSIKM